MANSGGITQAIRNHLNFTDEKRWREFSTRRLELIDRFNLSSKKASEQDDSIKQIANILRIEFTFPESTIGDFDKLVRAAVQSVRRNRKRSSKSRLKNNRFILVDETSNNKVEPLHYVGAVSKPTLSYDIDNMRFKPLNKIDIKSLVSSVSSSSAINSDTAIANTAPQTSSIAKLPSFENINFTNSTSNTSRSNFEISEFTRKKFLNFIDKSKSCLSLSNNDPSIHEDNLLSLGRSTINSSISFVLERFFNDLPSNSISYLYEKLQSIVTVSKILKSLGFQFKDVQVLNDVQASNLLYKLVGCCIKDFGFDQLVYIFGEMIHEIILKEYPLISTQISKFTIESLISPTLSIIPSDADIEFNKQVELKFGSKLLNFTYSPLSSAAPTFLELIGNGKTAFSISIENKFLRLKDYINNIELSNNEDVEKLFKSDERVIKLELFYNETDAEEKNSSISQTGNSNGKPKPLMKFTPLL